MVCVTSQQLSQSLFGQLIKYTEALGLLKSKEIDEAFQLFIYVAVTMTTDVNYFRAARHHTLEVVVCGYLSSDSELFFGLLQSKSNPLEFLFGLQGLIKVDQFLAPSFSYLVLNFNLDE